MFSAEEINLRSAGEALLTTPQPVVAYAGETALTLRRQRRAVVDSSAEKARQAMQESMDLREQGHADD